MRDNLNVLGHFYELELQTVLKFSENMSQDEIFDELEQNFAELEQNFAELGQNFAELGQNLALSQGRNTQKKPFTPRYWKMVLCNYQNEKIVHFRLRIYVNKFETVPHFLDGRNSETTRPTKIVHISNERRSQKNEIATVFVRIARREPTQNRC